MAIPKKKLIAAKIRGVMSTLERTPPNQKKNHVSLDLAFGFNEIRKEVGEEYPDLKDDLPVEISTRGPGTSLGVAMVTFLDLEILCEQLLNLVSLVDET